MPTRRTLLRLALAAGLGSTLLLAPPGCYGPTLPLPPPTALVEAPDETGNVLVTGEVLADAYVLVLNLDLDAGVIGRADSAGRYSVQLQGASGNTLEIWQMVGSQNGQVRTAIVPTP